MLNVTEDKWNDYIGSGKTLGEMLYENDSEMLKSLDIESNKNNRVIVARSESYKETIANSPHSPRLTDNKLSRNSEEVNKNEIADTRYSEEIPIGIREIKEKYKNETTALFISENANDIKIDNMVVKEELRNKGVGTSILNDVIAYADSVGKRILLTPTTELGTQKKLTNWYKRYGFKENKGRNADLTTYEKLIREPKSSIDSNTVKSKFSMDLPVEETKNLIALHNLTEDNLLAAIELGGFAMPSIAITKADMGHIFAYNTKTDPFRIFERICLAD